MFPYYFFFSPSPPDFFITAFTRFCRADPPAPLCPLTALTRPRGAARGRTARGAEAPCGHAARRGASRGRAEGRGQARRAAGAASSVASSAASRRRRAPRPRAPRGRTMAPSRGGDRPGPLRARCPCFRGAGPAVCGSGELPGS